MVGCGNSKLSEEMAEQDNYQNIYNMDISPVVLEKMKSHNSDRPDKFPHCHHFQHVIADATRLAFRDNFFDITIDKGTYDALACSDKDKTPIKNLTQEMLRVTRKGGALVIITNGVPQKRLKDLESFAELA